MPMCITTPFSKHPQLRSPKGLSRRFEGTSASLKPSRARDVRVSDRMRRLGRTGEPVTRRSGQGHNGDGANEGQTNNGKVASTWQDQGTLTVHRLRKTPTAYPLPPRRNSLRRQLRCTSSSTGEKAALGFAVGKFCFPKNELRADSELCKRADTVAMKPHR